jgi:hypothetical protein
MLDTKENVKVQNLQSRESIEPVAVNSIFDDDEPPF